jgi:protein AATF/BFR2
LKELQVQKKKEVDRKATKGRKIRYVVHEKLLNFMTPDDNHKQLEGKEAIIKNLFNLNYGAEKEEKI